MFENPMSEPGTVWWRPDDDGCERVFSPWAGKCPASLTDQPHAIGIPILEKPEFTLECWVCRPENQPQTPRRQDVGSLTLKGGCHGDLYIDENLYLCFTLCQGDDTLTVKSGKPVADAVFGGQWQHLAVTVRVMTGYFDTPAEAETNKLRRFNHIYLYCTRAGEPWPRLVGGAVDFMTPGIPVGRAGTLTIGGQADRRFSGALAQVALFPVCKSENQFATLGLKPPADLTISDDLPAGSGRDPVLDPEGNIVISGGERAGQIGDAYCFHFQVDGEPGPRRFVLATTPGSGGAASSAFISYDQKVWQRIPDACYEMTRGYGLFQKARSGNLNLAVNVERTPAWIATYIPFALRHVAEAEAEFAAWDCFATREIGRTPEGRPIKVWAVTASGGGAKQTIVLHNGQHGPFETHYGHTLVAMLRALRARPDAADILAGTAFLIFPISNVDGAEDGGHAFLSRNARNLNRDWGLLSQPETQAVATCIDEWAAAGNEIVLGFDFHSCHSFDSVHTVSDESLAARSPTLPARQALLERLLEEKMGLPRRNNKALPAAPSDRMLRLQDRFVNLYHAPCALFELSLFAAVNPTTGTLEPFGQHTLLDRGPQLLEVCLSYLTNRS